MEFFLSLLNDNQLVLVSAGVGMLVAIANFITMLSPSVHSNPIFNFVLRVLNVLSMNVGLNKNADDKDPNEL